jgi:hypothetical protein
MLMGASIIGPQYRNVPSTTAQDLFGGGGLAAPAHASSSTQHIQQPLPQEGFTFGQQQQPPHQQQKHYIVRRPTSGLTTPVLSLFPESGGEEDTELADLLGDSSQRRRYIFL